MAREVNDDLPRRQFDAEDGPDEDPPNAGRDESDLGVLSPVERDAPFRQEDAELPPVQDE